MHTPDTELASRLEAATKHVFVGGRYAHYKNPAMTYEVVGLAIAEADETVQVIYRAEYGARVMFSRPYASWMDDVELAGGTVKRFTRVS